MILDDLRTGAGKNRFPCRIERTLTDMHEMALRPLPYGASSFPKLRNDGMIYVDKTAIIEKMIASSDKIFFARPRRFGKSLLASALESLFADGLRHFQGLAIESSWTDRQYPVVRLDFSEAGAVRDAGHFEKRFAALVASGFEGVGFQYDAASYKPVWTQLSAWLKSQPSKSLVLLIDEYDAPLTQCLSSPDLFYSVRDVLADFFAVLKANDGAFRFFFMTGITRFSKTSIFSELNNLRDITLDPDFGSLLGYTRSEIRQYFSGYLEKASRALELPEEPLLDEMARHYDGFCFDMMAREKVFAPWSVINFFSNPALGFRNYWFESGGQPGVLLEYLKSHALRSPEAYETTFHAQAGELNARMDAGGIDDKVLLFQTGYLTVKSSDGDSLELGFPNSEVASSMSRLYGRLVLGEETYASASMRKIKRSLECGDGKAFLEELNRLFLGIDYKDYPVDTEARCRAMMSMILYCCGLDPVSERHNSLGRSDIETDAGPCHWVFELKLARPGETPAKLCDEAVSQMRVRRYGEEVRSEELRRMALVFSEEKRQFTNWAWAD